MTILLAGKTIELENIPLDIRKPLKTSGVQTEQVISLPDDGLSLEKVEIELIKQALNKTAGNRSKAARLLGLTRDTLLYRIKKYSLG